MTLPNKIWLCSTGLILDCILQLVRIESACLEIKNASGEDNFAMADLVGKHVNSIRFTIHPCRNSDVVWIICLCESIYDFPFTKSINTQKNTDSCVVLPTLRISFNASISACEKSSAWQSALVLLAEALFGQRKQFVDVITYNVTWCANMLQVLLLVCLLVLVGVFLFGWWLVAWSCFLVKLARHLFDCCCCCCCCCCWWWWRRWWWCCRCCCCLFFPGMVSSFCTRDWAIQVQRVDQWSNVNIPLPILNCELKFEDFCRCVFVDLNC